MKKYFFYSFFFGALTVQAQSPRLLDSIAANNTALRALQSKSEAEILKNNTNLRLADPEAEVGYMFGTPKGLSHRTNVSVSQSLDWALMTGRKRKLADAGNELSESVWRAERQRILSEARQSLTLAVFCNKLCSELERRLKLAREVERLYEAKFENGDINLLEVNKVKLNTSVAQAELKRARSERQRVQLDLQRLNGGVPLLCTDTLYAVEALPALSDLQERVGQSHPLVAGAQAAVAQSRENIRVAKAEAWPEFSVGFSGEYAKDSKYNGVTLGVRIPLWGGTRAKVKQFRSEAAARQLDEADVRNQLAGNLQQAYASAVSLQHTADELQRNLQTSNNEDLLRRSLDEGQITLLDYLLELSFYYNARTAWLEAERDARLAAAEVWGLIR